MTPLGRINPAMKASRPPTSSSLLNPTYMTSDEEGSQQQHGGYEQSKYETKRESKFDKFDHKYEPAKYEPKYEPKYEQSTPSYPTSSSSSSAAAHAMPAATWKRSMEDSNDSDSNPATSERKKKRKSRWGGDEKEKTFIPGMPTVLPANLTKDQEEAYLGNFKLFILLVYKCNR